MRNALVITLISSAISAAMADMSGPFPLMTRDFTPTLGSASTSQGWDLALPVVPVVSEGRDAGRRLFGAATWQSSVGRAASFTDGLAGRFAGGTLSGSFSLPGVELEDAGNHFGTYFGTPAGSLGKSWDGSADLTVVDRTTQTPSPSASLLGFIGLGALVGARRRLG